MGIAVVAVWQCGDSGQDGSVGPSGVGVVWCSEPVGFGCVFVVSPRRLLWCGWVGVFVALVIVVVATIGVADYILWLVCCQVVGCDIRHKRIWGLGLRFVYLCCSVFSVGKKQRKD